MENVTISEAVKIYNSSQEPTGDIGAQPEIALRGVGLQKWYNTHKSANEKQHQADQVLGQLGTRKQ